MSALIAKADRLYEQHNYAAAIAAYEAALRLEMPAARRMVTLYNLACTQALAGKADAALQALAAAHAAGFDDAGAARADADLTVLRSDPRFVALLKEMDTSRAARVLKDRTYTIDRLVSPDLGWAAEHSFDEIDTAYYASLRTRYRLDALVANKPNDLARILAVTNWVHAQWRHNGQNQPSKPDALTILREVQGGKQFRCVEYAIVLAQALQAVGYPARTLGLIQNGLTWEDGRGHVVAEVWAFDLNKWILVDGQNNATWQLAGLPLSAVEVRDALAAHQPARMVQGPSTWRNNDEAMQAQIWGRYFDKIDGSFTNVFVTGTRGRGFELIDPARFEPAFAGVSSTRGGQTQDLAKVYPKLGQVHLELTGGNAKAPLLTVALQHAMPWFSHYELSTGGAPRRQAGPSLAWDLVPGVNTLRVRAVNRRGLAGPWAEVALRFTPAT